MTMDAMQDKLIKTHGGYLQVRYTDMGKFLDYLEDFPTGRCRPWSLVRT